jgi:hypothetical protein
VSRRSAPDSGRATADGLMAQVEHLKTTAVPPGP